MFAAALVGNDKVPGRLRHLLNVESGVNDGLALPFVVVLLAVAAGSDDLHLGDPRPWELALGIAIGVVVPWVAIRLERTRWFAASPDYLPLNAVAIGLLVLALGKATHGNLFLAAFAAGITVATFGPTATGGVRTLRRDSSPSSSSSPPCWCSARCLAPAFFADIAWTGWVFAVLALVVARPVALWISFLRSGLGLREQFAAMWFGPKGFASVVYGLLVLELRHRRRRRDLPPRRAHHRAVDPAPLLHRRPRRPHLRRRPRHPGLARDPAPQRSIIAVRVGKPGGIHRPVGQYLSAYSQPCVEPPGRPLRFSSWSN